MKLKNGSFFTPPGPLRLYERASRKDSNVSGFKLGGRKLQMRSQFMSTTVAHWNRGLFPEFGQVNPMHYVLRSGAPAHVA